MAKLTVRGYMTAAPHTIGADQTLTTAHRIMREHHIRHLPVLADGKLVGVVTEGDLRLIETLKDVDQEQVLVEEAMTPDPYTIAPETSLEWVALEMAQHKYGSVIVVEHGRVVGVFTTVDALRALQDLLGRARRRRRAPASRRLAGMQRASEERYAAERR
jgi:acetoin utilization protein AcuB